jgi:DNA invertase Pin-like site-specific DNA recombinase
MQQVERHQESTRLQYDLSNLATNMGWSRQRVLVIDEDLGQSATSAEGRPGFRRLVAEVGLDHVGIVLGVEMSRLARCCRDWYQLLEICAMFGTLIGDMDGIYDPADYNDRLLLGLKGTMSEAELHILKRRMLEGMRGKARRGELGMQVPRGYFRRPSGEVIKDPDEQVQDTVQLVFDLFKRYGTMNAVLRHLVRNAIQLPNRVRSGVSKSELEWRRPNRATLNDMLHNPIYAGAYVYGRRPTDPRKKKPGRPSTGKTVARFGQWEVLLKDRLPAYITWEQYEQNIRQLELNANQALGAPRSGPSLLSGLVVCGRCGMRMGTAYTNNGKGLRYVCSRRMVDYGEDLCQSLPGKPLDELVAKVIFQALEPAALEISLRVAEDIEAQRAQLVRHWEQRLERARYAVERAFRQYNVVEPENRLVARTLERQWEEALGAEEELKREYERFLPQHPPCLSAQERNAIRQLSSDIPAIWHASSTTPMERQAIVRQLIERITVTVDGRTEKVKVEFQWAGGHKTETVLIRPVARLEQLNYYGDLLSRVAELHAEQKKYSEIAQILNEEGWRPAKRRETFNSGMVQNLLIRQGLRKSKERVFPEAITKKSSEWTLPDLAEKLGMPPVSLYSWIKKGKLEARRVRIGGRCILLIDADEAEVARLQSLRNQPRTWSKHVRLMEAERY